MVENYEIEIINRMGGWSVQYRHRGAVRDKFFTSEKEREEFISNLNSSPRGYYH